MSSQVQLKLLFFRVCTDSHGYITMEYQHSSFSVHDIDQYGMGGGVLPFSIDNEGCVRILLGRERFIPSWKGSCRWSGFEGTRKDIDASLEQTAIREFKEESLGVIADDVELSISQRQFYMRIVLRICTEKYPERYHSTYVVRVMWDESLPKKFQVRRNSIEYIDRLAQQMRISKQLLFENASEIYYIHRMPCTSDNDDDRQAQNERVEVFVSAERRRNTSVSSESTSEHTETVSSSMSASEVRHVFSGRSANQVLEWKQLRDKLTRVTTEHEYPCIRVLRDSNYNLLQEIDISNDYMEKDQIRWWYVHELEQVLLHHGQWREERFRPYFLAVLQVFMNESRSGEAFVNSDDTRRFAPRESSVSRQEERGAPSIQTEHQLPQNCPTDEE